MKDSTSTPSNAPHATCWQRTPQAIHVERFFRMYKRAADMMLMRLFPNTKEITESMGALRALRQHVPWAQPKRSDFTVVAVGDGNTPRTAGLCAFNSAWRCISIDPRMNQPHRWPMKIQRLEAHKDRVENVPMLIAGDVAILAVHSHAYLDSTLASVKATGRRSLVAMPCCVRLMPEQQPDVTFDDQGVWSPQRTIHVWRMI